VFGAKTIGRAADRVFSNESRALQRLPLVVGLLLVLQWEPLLRGASHAISGYESALPTALFLLLSSATLMAPDSLLSAVRRRFSQLAFALFLVFYLASIIWSLGYGSTFRMAHGNLPVFALTAVLVASVFVVGFLGEHKWLVFAGIAAVVVAVGAVDISQHSFDEVFVPGRPLWNIRHAIARLQSGIWPYEYDYGLSLVYLPFLVVPYLPFGVLGVDLRWGSICAALTLVGLIWWVSRQNSDRGLPLVCAVVCLSPSFLYNLLTTQVAWYWLYLGLFILALGTRSGSFQRTALLLASFSRQLAWPLWLPWLLSKLTVKRSFGSPRRTDSDPTRLDTERRSFVARALPVLAISVWDALLSVVVAAAILVNPRGFLLSTFVMAQADARDLTDSGLTQPAGSIALTPLLPFAQDSTLVLLAQVVLVSIVCYALWHSGLLHTRPCEGSILVYMAFLSLNVVVYSYYWLDIVVMTVVWIGVSGSGMSALSNGPSDSRAQEWRQPGLA
jgi:hypothetical protein